MKNKVFKFLSVCLIFVLLCVMPSYASDDEDAGWVLPVTTPSKFLPKGSTVAKSSTIMPRGKYFSVAVIQISNPESGVIGITGNTVCSQSVDKIYMKIYLDVYKDNKWRQVDSWSFNTYDEMTNLQYIEITDFDSGYYYRLRGTHVVYEGDEKENRSTFTDGLYCE